MGKKSRKSKKGPLQESADLVNNPFGALSSDGLEPGPKPEPQAPPMPTTQGVKLVVRLERKGRRGKTVTVIEGFPVEPTTDDLIRALRRDLGTGGTVYEDVAELQGDQRKKAAEWLRSKGYTVKGA